MELTTPGGLIFALVAILGGQMLEGGHPASLVQASAFIIVIGGTIASLLVAYPGHILLRGVKMLGATLKKDADDTGDVIAKLVELAGMARTDGILALEQRLGDIPDPFMKRGLQFVVDGVDARVTRDALEAQIGAEFEENVSAAKIWESAGGFAPTIGILGAVLGLIHVMENLSDPSKLGGGIATAFVATVYAVGFANLVFLPIANKLKIKFTHARERQTLIAEGVLSIQEGLNPRVLEEKLKAYSGGHGGGEHAEAPKE